MHYPLKSWPGLFNIVSMIVIASILVACDSSIPFLAFLSPSATSTSTATSLPTPTPTYTPSATPSSIPTITPSTTVTPTPTRTATSTITPTPTQTLTPTITPSPTFEFPSIVIKMQANCRYGPDTAYLYSFGLYPGDHALIQGRTNSGTWLWIKPDNLNRHCWVAASVGEVTGDVFTVVVVETNLPITNALYSAPNNVQAVREGDKVTVSWDRVNMTEDDDRGYLIEATTCHGGHLVFDAVRTDNTFYEFIDEQTCSIKSSGLLYTVEKHGYTTPVEIPWP